MSGFEVSGKKGTPLSVRQLCASAENFDLFCHPCDEDHNRVEACGFCVECNEYLCGECVQHHRKVRLTRNHIIKDKDSMPRDVKQVKPIPQSKDVCTEPCTKHHGKVLEYYCESHKEFACSVCVTLRHITCGVGYIPELATGIVNSNEYKQMLQQIDYLQNEFQTTKEFTSKSISEVESESKAYKEKVTKLGEELINHIKQLMQTTLDEKNVFVQKLLVKLNSSRKQNEQTIEEISSIKSKLESKNSSDVESLVLMKKLPPTIKEIENSLKKRQIESKPTVFQFTENPDLQCAKGIKIFGTLRTYKKIVEQLHDINIYAEGDKNTPYITGMEVLSDGRLAIVDNKNKSIKLADTKKNLTTNIQLQYEPWDITEVSKGQLVVTLPYERNIQYLTVTDKDVRIKHLIETDLHCRGIAALQNKLIVSSSILDEVLILDLSGRVLRRITTGDNGEQLFSWPAAIAVNPSNNLIYVSDSDMNTLTCITLEGNVKFINKIENSKVGMGLAIDADGSVFVCEEDGIQHITEEGRKIRTLLVHGQEGAISTSIAYDNNTGNIFLGSVTNYLKVYHLE